MPVKSKVKISQNFVAFSEYMNFTNPIIDLFLSPGFPLTLRLENPIQESLASVSSFGHPVVDTTGAIGQG